MNRKKSSGKWKPSHLEVGIDNGGFERDGDNVSSNRKISTISNNNSIAEEDVGVEGRDNWDSPIEFLLSCISMSVGLGNIWRFPKTAVDNGGGAFLIPYIIVLIFIGRPIYFLEMALGQFASFGSVKIWTLAPFFKGIGYIGILAAFVTLSYYCSIIATTIYYFAVSFQKTLPWTECKPEWIGCTNDTAPDFYYKVEVSQQLTNIDDGIGWPIWELTLCLLAAWIFIFLSLVKGVESSGKVAYFTAIFPYVVLFTFLIRGATLEGAWTGISYFITPQWEKIYEPSVWYAAVGQCFFSLGTGTGTITMFSSYNPFRHPAYRDALIISLMDTFTSLLAGVTIFAVLGHLSSITGVAVSEMGGGPGLVFISYPSAISKFTWVPQLFAVLFFLMLFTLGIGSANALAGAPITVLLDQFPFIKKWQMTLMVCIFGFATGIMFVTPGGQFMVTFMDFYGANFILYFLCMMEVTVVAWFYGLTKFTRDIEFMLGVKIGWYWKICWGFVIPVGLSAVLIYTFATLKPLTHENTAYPSYVTAIGWCIVAFAVLLLPAWGLHAIHKTEGDGFKEKFLNSFYPRSKWGPRAPHYRKGWEIFKTLGEMKYTYPVTDSKSLTVKIRGHKERILITPEHNSLTIRCVALSSDAEIEESSEATGILGKLHKLFKHSTYSWLVKENTFESFHITANCSKGIITSAIASKVYNNDYVITIHFGDLGLTF